LHSSGFLSIGRNKLTKACRNSANAVIPVHTVFAKIAVAQRPTFRQSRRLLVPANYKRVRNGG
jgi:hypothetical protein